MSLRAAILAVLAILGIGLLGVANPAAAAKADTAIDSEKVVTASIEEVRMPRSCDTASEPVCSESAGGRYGDRTLASRAASKARIAKPTTRTQTFFRISRKCHAWREIMVGRRKTSHANGRRARRFEAQVLPWPAIAPACPKSVETTQVPKSYTHSPPTANHKAGVPTATTIA